METNNDEINIAKYEDFSKIMSELIDRHIDINHHKYAGREYLGNFKVVKEFGINPWKVVLARMAVKMKSLEDIALEEDGGSPSVEVVELLSDLAIYCVICRILYEEEHE